jgi:hypothetical protein
MTRSANREAVTYFEQALAAVGHMPDTGERSRQAIDLRRELRSALSPLGEWDRALDYLRDARTLAEALGDQGRLGWVFANMATPLSLQRHHHRSRLLDLPTDLVIRRALLPLFPYAVRYQPRRVSASSYPDS